MNFAEFEVEHYSLQRDGAGNRLEEGSGSLNTDIGNKLGWQEALRTE